MNLNPNIPGDYFNYFLMHLLFVKKAKIERKLELFSA